MGNHYILSVDSFVNSFSIVETTDQLRFQFKKAGGASVTSEFTKGDMIFVYKKQPCGFINILLEAKGDNQYQKILEVSQGVALVNYNLALDPEIEDVISIDGEIYNRIIKQMLSGTKLDGESASNTVESETLSRETGAENILLYGVPGVGKSHTIREEYCDDSERMERVVFHPDYTYSDFVGQILPRVVDGQLKYVFTPGPFTKLLKKAWENPSKKFYLIMEEINRGNAPAIFGEIFQLLDRKDGDGRVYSEKEYGESEYGITNYEVAGVVYGDEEHEVKIPSNMWILATMNTADQNVFTLDTAFQRRWNMHHIKNDVMSAIHSKEKIEGTSVEWGAFATVINDMVVEIDSDLASSEDKRLGAYFVKLNELSVDKFPEKVLKYLWDDAFKMDKEAIFDERFKSLEMVIDEYEQSNEDKLRTVLRMDVYRKMLETMDKE